MTYASQRGFVAVALVFSVLCILVTLLRFTARLRHKVALGFDDGFIVPAASVVVASGLTMVIGAYQGPLGKHTHLNTPDELDQEKEMQKWELTLLTLHVWGTGLVRLSILFFCRRIFRGRFSLTHFDVINWTYIALVTANMLGMFAANLALCVPNLYQLDTPAATGLTLSGYCLDTRWLQAKSSIINFVLDFLVAAIPICRVTQIQMSWTRKFQAMAVFSVGLFAVAAALARMIIVLKLQTFAKNNPRLDGDASVMNLAGTDTLGLISSYLFWSYVEMSLGVLVASLPSAFRLVDKKDIRSSLSRLGLLSPRPSDGEKQELRARPRRRDYTQTNSTSRHDSACTSEMDAEEKGPRRKHSDFADHVHSAGMTDAEGIETPHRISRDDLDVP